MERDTTSSRRPKTCIPWQGKTVLTFIYLLEAAIFNGKKFQTASPSHISESPSRHTLGL